MSCRIDRISGEEDLVVLSISGRITGDHVNTLRAVMEQETEKIAIDLQNVLLVDRAAVSLLAVSENSGTEIRNCSAYIREWITRERADMQADGPNQGTRAREDIDDV